MSCALSKIITYFKIIANIFLKSNGSEFFCGNCKVSKCLESQDRFFQILQDMTVFGSLFDTIATIVQSIYENSMLILQKLQDEKIWSHRKRQSKKDSVLFLQSFDGKLNITKTVFCY